MTRCSLTSLFFFLIFTNSSAQIVDSDEIVVDAPLVVLNVVVTDQDANYIHGLRQKDFVVKEDGVEQTIEFVQAESAAFAAAILLDISGSMEYRVSLARSAAIRFLGGLRPGDHAAIYSFDSRVKLVQEFSESRDMASKIFDLKAKGYTALNDAVVEAANALRERKERRRAIVLLSDGSDNRSKASASKALKTAQAADATIYTVDMSPLDSNRTRNTQNRSVLKKYAKETGGIFVATPGGVDLRETFSKIVGELGVQYTIGYYSGNSKKNGKWRSVSLSTNDSYHILRTRRGYYGPKANDK